MFRSIYRNFLILFKLDRYYFKYLLFYIYNSRVL